MKPLVHALVLAATISIATAAVAQNNEALYREKSAQVLQAIEQGTIKASTGFLQIAALARSYLPNDPETAELASHAAVQAELFEQGKITEAQFTASLDSKTSEIKQRQLMRRELEAQRQDRALQQMQRGLEMMQRPRSGPRTTCIRVAPDIVQCQ